MVVFFNKADSVFLARITFLDCFPFSWNLVLNFKVLCVDIFNFFPDGGKFNFHAGRRQWLFFGWFLIKYILDADHIRGVAFHKFLILLVNLLFCDRKRYLSDVEKLLSMTDKDFIVVGENSVFKPCIERNLVQVNFKVSPNFNSVIFCSCQYNFFFQIHIQRHNVSFMIESIVIGQGVKLIIDRIELHKLKKTVWQDNCQSIVEALDKTETQAQENRPETKGFLVVELYEPHVFFAAYWHQVTVSNRFLVNSLDWNNLFAVVSDSSVNSVHCFDR